MCEHRKNESEIYGKNNKVLDQAGLYINLSNKVCSHQYDDLADTRLAGKAKPIQGIYLRQTTAKSGHFTGANKTCADSNQKKLSKHLKSDFEHDFTVGTVLRNKSFTSRKLNFYSDFEQE